MSGIPYLSACAVLLFALLLALLAGCSAPNGQPKDSSEAVAPSQVMDFATLYAQNCSACHGAEGRGGASLALANPVYLAIVDENAAHNLVANGVRGTSMPAFAQSAGGLLTDEQINVITSGMFSHWGRKGILDGTNPPLYAAKTTADAAQGGIVFLTFCASCHGTEGQGSKASSISNGSFLALVSDQGLRTIVITGRPELGAPDWRANVPGQPMSDQEITDVVAWLVSRRVRSPGQPYSSNSAQHQHSDQMEK